MRPALATIGLQALRQNLRRARSAARASRVFAVVKANAYGHGLGQVLAGLNESDAFAVACIEEALALRKAGVQKPILLLQGFVDHQELELSAEHDFWCAIHDESQLGLLKQYPPDNPIRTWLKIDTGMHRLGFKPELAGAVIEQLRNSRAVLPNIGLMTHFASADMLAEEKTLQQLTLWRRITGQWPGEKSLANSAAVLAWPASHADWIRPGIMLYGISPFPDTTGADYGLTPAMTLSTKLIAVKALNHGDRVGYGATWTAQGATRLGIAAIGYGDGYPRHAPSGTPVLIDGREAALAGRVSMDMLTIDLSTAPGARVGSEVTLWGPKLPLERIAGLCGTIGYELLCKITPRVRFSISS